MSIKSNAIAVIAGTAVFAAVSASAATLGGIQSDDVGANSNVVKAQLENGVNVAWTTAFDSALGAYEVTGVTLTTNGAETIPATASVKLTLTDSTGAVLTELSGTGGILGAPASTIAAHDVYGVSLVINGGTVSTAVTTTK
jgi:hypothetical protein